MWKEEEGCESVEAFVPTWAHLEPLEWEGFIPKSAFDLRPDALVIVYNGSLFETQVPHKLDAPS